MNSNVRSLSQSQKQSRRFSENRSLRRQPITGTVCGRRQLQAAPLSSTLACLPSDADLSPLSCSNCFQEYKKRKEKQLPNHVSYENDAINEDYESSVENEENKMTAKGSNRGLDS
jgi:hypothetical protein